MNADQRDWGSLMRRGDTTKQSEEGEEEETLAGANGRPSSASSWPASIPGAPWSLWRVEKQGRRKERDPRRQETLPWAAGRRRSAYKGKRLEKTDTVRAPPPPPPTLPPEEMRASERVSLLQIAGSQPAAGKKRPHSRPHTRAPTTTEREITPRVFLGPKCYET